MQNLPGSLEIDGWSSTSKTLGIDSAMENSRVTSPLQKVWGHFKSKEATCAMGAVQRPGQELCCGQLKVMPVFFL